MTTQQANKPLEWKASARQSAFIRRTEYEVLYGGAKMGGKTDVLLMWSILRRMKYAGSRGLFIRRQIAEVLKQGAAWDRAHKLLGDKVKYTSSPVHAIKFPNGSVLEFGHCKDEESKQHYQGGQYDDICVLRGTPVLMGDGSWKAIEEIVVGEMVATLEGARAVTATQTMGVQPVARVVTAYGSAVFSSTHRFMLADGSWASPNSLLSRQSPPFGRVELASSLKYPADRLLLASQYQDRRQVSVPVGQGVRGTADSLFAAWSADDQSGYGESANSLRGALQRETWTGQIALLSRVLPLGGWVGGGDRSGHDDSSLQGFPIGYLGDLRSYGEPARPFRVGDLGDTRLLGDVEERSLGDLHWGGLESTHEHIPGWYIHPYTREIRSRSEDVRPVVAYMDRAGEGEVFDLTVASASHFIVFPGIIAQNCFDQLEQFTESMYLFIGAACRTPQDAPPRDARGAPIDPRIRASANPGSIGHSWVKARFVDVGVPEVSYDYTLSIPSPRGTLSVRRARVFIPSTLFDNPFASPDYAATLYNLAPALRDAYLYGKWDVFVGQAFPDFHPVTETGEPWHVIPQAPIPLHWRRFGFHDWGYAGQCYTGWGALDPDGGVVVYKELVVRGWNPDEIARGVLDVQGADRVGAYWCGHDIFAEHRAHLTQQQMETLAEKGQLQLSVVDQYRAAGWTNAMLAMNIQRIPGKQRIHGLLKQRPQKTPGEMPVPWLRIMDNCPVLIKTMQLIQGDPKRTEDVITDYAPDDEMRDDPYDALRYGLMSSDLNGYSEEPQPDVVWSWRR